MGERIASLINGIRCRKLIYTHQLGKLNIHMPKKKNKKSQGQDGQPQTTVIRGSHGKDPKQHVNHALATEVSRFCH